VRGDQDGKPLTLFVAPHLLAILAVCAGHTVNAVEKKHGSYEASPSMHHVGQLAAALKLDMAEYWQATAKGYFGRNGPLIRDEVDRVV